MEQQKVRDFCVKPEEGEGCSAPLGKLGNSTALLFTNFLVSSMSGGC